MSNTTLDVLNLIASATACAVVQEAINLGILNAQTLTGAAQTPAAQDNTQAAVRQPRARANAKQTAAPVVAVPVASNPWGVSHAVVLPKTLTDNFAPENVARAQANAALAANVCTAHAPEGITAKVGGEKDSRIKLPKALFEEFSTVVLEWPNGARTAVSEDTEGRARFSRKDACEHSGAREGQYLKFEETNKGHFAVSVRDAVMRPARVLREPRTETPKQSAGRTYEGKFGGMFADVAPIPSAVVAPIQAAVSHAAGAQKAKRPVTPAQLKAREEFATKKRAIRCAGCDARVKIGDTQETEKGRMCPECMTQFARAFQQTYGRAPVTPNYEKGNKKGRKGPKANVGAKQMTYAAVPVAQAAAPTVVAVPLGVTDASERGRRMKEAIAAGKVGVRAVPLPKR